MLRKIYTTALVFGCFLSLLTAQQFRLDLGLNGGVSQLYHKTRFETTTLYNLYKFTAISHPEGYTWEQFTEDYEIRNSFMQPRFGFSALASYGELPLFLMAEMMSSPSSYQKMMVGVSGGVGKEFYDIDSSFYASFQGGYKFVRDFGFGSSTLVNSIRNDEARSLAASFFDPKQPLGKPSGNLFVLRVGFGKALGYEHRMFMGVDLFGELDLTPQIARESRMNTIGALAYLRFRLF
jgi:hypothetical protein